MKITKVFLFVCSFFLIGSFSASAYNTATSQATIDIVNSFISPDLKITIHHDYINEDNSNGPVYASYDIYNSGLFEYELSWAKVENATNCTLDGDLVDVNGGIKNKKNNFNNKNIKHTLTCWSASISQVSDSVIIANPPKIENLVSKCNLANTLTSVTWSAPAGFDTYYVRSRSEMSGYNAESKDDKYNFYEDDWKSNFKNNMTVNEKKQDEKYEFWVHSKAPNGAFSEENKINVSCPPEPKGVWTWDGTGFTSCSAQCESSCPITRTQRCTIPGTCTGLPGIMEDSKFGTTPCKYSATIIATPKSIRKGGLTKVEWKSNDMNSCQGTSSDSNNNTWDATEDGSFTSSNLMKSTTYKIDCQVIDSTGNPIPSKAKSAGVTVSVDSTIFEEI